MLATLARWHDGLTRFGFYLGGATLCGIVVCFWIEVVARYFFNAPTLWSSSIVAYCLCLSASLAMPELARTRGHIAISVVQDSLPAARQQGFERVTALLTAAVCGLAAWMLISESARQLASGTTTAMGLDIPKVWVSSFIGYGFTNTALHFLRRAVFPATVEWPSDTHGDSPQQES
ncbi:MULTISPECIES: TRAP transporter small permease [Halomonas]|uniref:TRAP transporter small permease n=1 Tax=Halomonas TaxID=2745 RepID=UPI001A8C8B80|nr:MULTISPECIES: TRAP transporter small permease [Halomonas]MED5296117.1 TRAP transporter small permease [Pseudomonadota bacterium]MBN8412649.1 TRAP transporter small permease [Halomonas litopenaei]MBY5967912.1 TRAP transporter small permease [Halomonas denitrificans]MBY5983413.1 TRAP transporter small permease [Halomonas sp. DP5Y7-2]MBY6031096.1 TRAP transporter small permease [Halomonas sp. DP8Y7-1]